MQASATDPTFPIALALIYSAYKFFTKRKNRFPDGPHFGGSPIWGALGMTVLGLALGALVNTLSTLSCLLFNESQPLLVAENLTYSLPLLEMVL